MANSAAGEASDYNTAALLATSGALVLVLAEHVTAQPRSLAAELSSTGDSHERPIPGPVHHG